MTRYLLPLLLASCAGEQYLYCSYTCIDENVSDTATICGQPRRSKGCEAPEVGQAYLAQQVDVYRAPEATRAQESAVVVQVDDSAHFWISGGLVDYDLGAGLFADGKLLGIIEDGDDRWRFVRGPR